MRFNFKHTVLAILLSVVPLTSVQAEEIVVSAAISLSNAFKDIGASYEKKNPDIKVMFNFAGSGALLQQIDKGAPVDVFASADQKTMDMATEKKLIDDASRINFTSNKVVLIVPVESKQTAVSSSDLTSFKRIAVANPDSVPVGRYAKRSLEQNNLWDKLKDQYIYTQNVRQTLDYVARGEVDAGFVYSSDASLMKDKVKILFEVPLDIPVTYPIAVITTSKKKDNAKAFIEYINSDEGLKILEKYGFAAVKDQ